MSQNKDPFCLGCHWEAFHLDDGRGPDDAPDASQQPQWDCEHHAHDHCDFDEACCDMDDCSEHCGSVCDGFVDCDASTACSVSHCEDTHCEDTGPVCFDEYCFGPGADHGLESWLGFGGPGPGPGPGPVPLDNDLLSTAEHGQPAKTDSAGPEHADAGSLLMMPYSMGNYCDHPGSHFDCHFDCHFDPKDGGVNPSYPAGVDPAEVFHMLGMCPDFSSCHSYLPDGHSCHSSGNLPDEHSCQSSSGKLGGGNLPSTPFPCLHSEYPGHSPRGKKDLIGDSPAQGPCRQHRCRVQPHAHSHAFSPYSRHPRSSHLLPTPRETPPLTPTPSVLTSREFSADSDVHVCKWTTSNDGAKRSCGAAFSDPGSLQEHLVAKHLSTVDGPKGNGYYCCWEGCYRPDEPFSQKSKLQGHFLTHSNHKNFRCSVCGKSFARHATLERHERSHRGEKPFTCADCGKSFTDSSELKTHSRTHTGEKPFQCTYPGCDFQTGDSSNMSSHRLTHGERKHKCVYAGCGKSFTRPDQLKRHMKTTHKDSSSLLSPSPGSDFGLSIEAM